MVCVFSRFFKPKELTKIEELLLKKVDVMLGALKSNVELNLRTYNSHLTQIDTANRSTREQIEEIHELLKEIKENGV